MTSDKNGSIKISNFYQSAEQKEEENQVYPFPSHRKSFDIPQKPVTHKAKKIGDEKGRSMPESIIKIP